MMKVADPIEKEEALPETAAEPDLLSLLQRRSSVGPTTPIVVGELVAIADSGQTPLVVSSFGPGGRATAARAVVDVHAAHIGSPVVLLFEDGDAARPIILGIVRSTNGARLASRGGEVEVEADGGRIVVSAKERLVLKCGAASVTLTKDGEVITRGTRVSSESSGIIRIKGSSVLIN